MLRRGGGRGADGGRGGGGPCPGRGDQSTRGAFGSNRHERPKKTEAHKVRREGMNAKGVSGAVRSPSRARLIGVKRYRGGTQNTV